MRKFLMIAGLGTLLISPLAFGQSETVMPMSTIIEKATSFGYTSIFEVELEHGVYKLEALDKNQQETDVRFDGVTGQLIPAEEQMPKKTPLEISQKLEKAGNQVLKIDLESEGYYKVKMIDPQGHKQEIKIPANEG